MADEPPSREPGPDAFGVLGPLEVRRSGRAVLLGGPRQRAGLALLVEANRAVSVGRLAAGVWGGHLAEGRVATVPAYAIHPCRPLDPSPGRSGGGARAEAGAAGRRPGRQVPMLSCWAAI